VGNIVTGWQNLPQNDLDAVFLRARSPVSLFVLNTRKNKEILMKLLEPTADRSHQQSTDELFQQAAKSDSESAQGDADQILALGERAISKTVSADPPATLKAIRQKSCE
jgi:hypothetical protein